MRQRSKDTIYAGLALFAMFLGAGNIIFPPYMGARTGSMWWLSTLGFVLTGTGLPLLGVLAVSKAGGTADAISSRVSPNFAKVFNTLILIFIGPLFCIPRTAATTVELSVVPYLPNLHRQSLTLVVAGIFFALCLSFALSENSVIDRMGKYLTPVLAAFMFFLIILAVVRPAGSPVAPLPEMHNFFYTGFKTGYQTMDGMGSIVLGGTVALTLMQKGYRDRELQRSLNYVALIAGVGLGIVYVGFSWIGASGSATLQGMQSYADLTVSAVQQMAGLTGQIFLSLLIFFACMTTATGLIVTLAKYFKILFNGRLSYRCLAIIVTLISYAVSSMGVDGIVNLAEPVLDLMYPAVIVLIILNLFGPKIRHDKAFRGAVYGTLLTSFIMFLSYLPKTAKLAREILTTIPLGEQGFPYLIPAAIGLIIGTLIERFYGAKAT
ncbi:MAG: branched-chain amino acid transport system II carrier protein [Eubacteriales bacterium]|nr:branched-chain amino acid transport system II carrier protein [Eubacteriales bacterium]